jgi:hypothetical protein
MSVKIVFDTWKHLNSATELQLNKSHEGQQIQWKDKFKSYPAKDIVKDSIYSTNRTSLS